MLGVSVAPVTTTLAQSVARPVVVVSVSNRVDSVSDEAEQQHAFTTPGHNADAPQSRVICMVHRRTRALIELGVTIPLLLVVLWIWKFLWDHEERWDAPIAVSPVSLAVGALSAMLRVWARDRNCAKIRTNWRRRVVAESVWQGWQRLVPRLSSDARTTRYNFAVGAVIGAVGYRLWYGLLHPLPSDE
jgi:hypothetical protein